MKREHKLYNVILPIWMVFLFPQLWAIIIPGNLIIDCLVLFLTLLALKHRGKGGVMKKLWWKFWLLGFAADAVGVAWMFLGFLLYLPFGSAWDDTVGHITHNPFAHPAAFLWPWLAWPWRACASTSLIKRPWAGVSCSPPEKSTSSP